MTAALAADVGSVWTAHGFADRYVELEARHRAMTLDPVEEEPGDEEQS